MRMFRKPLILTNCRVSPQIKRSKNGIDGILFKVNGEVVIKYDISQNYEIQNGLLEVKLEESYAPKKYSDHQVGIDNVAESYMSTKILEKGVASDIVIDSWNRYDEIIPLGRIVKFLIARDIYLFKLPKVKYAGSTPSWDVCISLAMYLKLCEKIENFEEKLHAATDIGDQIRGNLQKLDSEIRKGNYFSRHLVRLLQSLHSLNDELELAYNIGKHGYNIRFGGRGEPDYFIEDISVEQKSRFPEFEHIFKEKLPSSFQYTEALRDLIFEIKQYKKGLSRSNVFFYNVSRLVKSLKFYAGTELLKIGPNANSFNFADMFINFDIMMKTIFIFLEKGKVIVPYVKLYSIDPKIICPFPIPEDVFDVIEKEKSKPYINSSERSSNEADYP